MIWECQVITYPWWRQPPFLVGQFFCKKMSQLCNLRKRSLSEFIVSHHRPITLPDGRTSCSLCPSHVITSISLCPCSLHPSLLLSSISIHLSTSVPPVQGCSLTLQAGHMRRFTCAESTPAPGGFMPHRKQEWVSVFTVARGSDRYRKYSMFDYFHTLLFFERASLSCCCSLSSQNRCCRNYKCVRCDGQSLICDLEIVTWPTTAVW